MRRVVIERQRITRPGQLGLGFTPDDGLGLWQPHEYHIRDCIIDLSDMPLAALDEAAAVTWGASAIFRRCVIRGAGKLVLIGSGDAEKAAVEEGRRVFFEDCILEQGSRRFPEVQCGMRVTLKRCLIRNWGVPDRFNPDPKTPDRAFAAWAHTPGSRIDAVDCVFWQDAFWRPARQMWRDWTRHLGQAWMDEGWRGLLRPGAWLPGVCRGLVASDGGQAWAWHCYRNRWWIALPWRRTTAAMPRAVALELVRELEAMAMRLEVELPQAA